MTVRCTSHAASEFVSAISGPRASLGKGQIGLSAWQNCVRVVGIISLVIQAIIAVFTLSQSTS